MSLMMVHEIEQSLKKKGEILNKPLPKEGKEVVNVLGCCSTSPAARRLLVPSASGRCWHGRLSWSNTSTGCCWGTRMGSRVK